MRAVIFDMDGVLCHYELKKRLEVLSRLSGRTPAEIESAIWGSGFEEDADSGVYGSGDEIFAGLRRTTRSSDRSCRMDRGAPGLDDADP